jgi:hypothetical protein
MLFPRRTWALRVTERMGLAGNSIETTLLVDLLIWSAKEEAELMKEALGKTLSKAEGILMGAVTVVNNHSAIVKVSQDLKISPQDAERLLLSMRKSALELASENNFDTIVKVATRR